MSNTKDVIHNIYFGAELWAAIQAALGKRAR